MSRRHALAPRHAADLRAQAIAANLRRRIRLTTLAGAEAPASRGRNLRGCGDGCRWPAGGRVFRPGVHIWTRTNTSTASPYLSDIEFLNPVLGFKIFMSSTSLAL